MDAQDDLDTLARRVVSHCPPMAMVVAGAASSAIQSILRQPGASQVVLDAQIPYSREALGRYLGRLPESLCSVETARLLAWRAWNNAWQIAPADKKKPLRGGGLHRSTGNPTAPARHRPGPHGHL